MTADLSDTAHGSAAHVAPVLIALIALVTVRLILLLRTAW